MSPVPGLVLALSAAVPAAPPPAPVPLAPQERDELPAAGALLAEVWSRLGAPARLAAVKSRRLEGRASWLGLPGQGEMVETYAGPRKGKVVLDFDSYGETSWCVDGDLVWETDPLTGVTVHGGWSANEQIRSLARPQYVDWRELYTAAETTGIEKVRGVPCYRVELTPRDLVGGCSDAAEPPTDLWFVEVQRKLPREIHSRSLGADGQPTSMIERPSDWREVDGILYPHRVEVEISGFALAIEYFSIQHDVELPVGFFAPDESVREAIARGPEPPAGSEREVTVETLEERHVASIRLTCKHADLQRNLTVVLPEVMRHVLSVGSDMTGPPLVRYHSWGDGPDAELDIEGAIPVAGPIEEKGRVKSRTLPGGTAVVAWHVGPYEQLGRTHQRVMAYLEAHDLEAREACWEEYWTDPGMEPDPSKWRTKVVWPVKPKQAE